MLNFDEIKKTLQPIAQRHSIGRLALFGSYARGEANSKSDIDLLIDLENKHYSLLDFVRIKQEMETALKTPIDLVQYNTIKSRIKAKILSEQISLL